MEQAQNCDLNIGKNVLQSHCCELGVKSRPPTQHIHRKWWPRPHFTVQCSHSRVIQQHSPLPPPTPHNT
ncbi:hypothetical protein J6590_054883 [Homalodisca vitripennis]|nr:hypothetical protein J6590_054883 [Homalodisca vitripennis]